MYTLLHGLNMKRTASLFALFALMASFGIGNMVQANSVIDGLGYIFPELHAIPLDHRLCTGRPGRPRHPRRCEAYCAGGQHHRALHGHPVHLCSPAGLINHAAEIPGAFALIFNMALNPWSVAARAVGEAIRWGVARGLFSNEAGLGSSPMAHAAARTNEPVREGLVAMMEPFIDTLVICTMTGLVIVVTGAWQESGEH